MINLFNIVFNFLIIIQLEFPNNQNTDYQHIKHNARINKNPFFGLLSFFWNDNGEEMEEWNNYKSNTL
ncbi:hypothetical protein D1632_10385 [Chryseobacterium nematophagum]|uniref:Uncharacterized protein n=1 Tax=Chryseobacterium nematophagum TaxID=2305228 RepID=A0A3M7LD70_9FLAO|nr:hypothetical protein D1632_10385 [Chryseobacterium nematophagum]